MNICLINFESVWKDKLANIRQKRVLITEAIEHRPDIDIIVFPELSLTGYILDSDAEALAENLTGESLIALQDEAKKHSVAIIFGFIEVNPHGKPYNSVVVISKSGEVITTYRKNHLFSQ